MEEESLICPACGKDNAQVEAPAEEAAAAPAVEKEEPAAELLKKEKKPVENKAKNKKKRSKSGKGDKVWKITAAIILCVALVGGLVATIATSLGIGIAPIANDLGVKSKYVTSDSTAKLVADRVVATLGDAKLTNSQLQVFFWMQYYDFLDYYDSYLSSLGLDTSLPLYQQKVPESEYTWEQYFVDAALVSWSRYQILVSLAEENGFEYPEELLTYIDSIPASIESNVAANGYANIQEFMDSEMGPGTSADDLVYYLTMYNKSLEYYDYLYTSLNPTQEELEQAYTENAETLESQYGVTKESGILVDVRHILIAPEGGEEDAVGLITYTDEAWAVCKAKAEKIYNEWKAGEATEESFGKLAQQYTEDPGSKDNGGLYTQVAQGKMVEAFDAWCFDESRVVGDTALVQTEFGYHVMYFVGSEEIWKLYTKDVMAYNYCEGMMSDYYEQQDANTNYRLIAMGKSDYVAG